MNWLRKIVSGKRKRLDQDGFNLDITYITNRVLAMSFPASGMESMYRNSKAEVIRYLDTKHENHYKVYNMSGRVYDTSKFNCEVESYDWEDHHPPEMAVLFISWHSMYNYLREDDENVVVIHWNAGKGRTGTSIAWFLIYSGLLTTAEDAIKYYGRKRFEHGKGVTQPSQMRYVKYFELIYKRKVCSPVARVLKSIYFIGVPWLSGNQGKMYFEIYEASDLTNKIYTSKSRKMMSYEFFNHNHDSTTK